MRFVAALLVLLSLCFIVFAEVPATPMINNDDGETSWVLNTQVSDEFNQGVLDRKWGQQLGNWKGSPPGAFKIGNAAVDKTGLLELITRHEDGYMPTTSASDCDCDHADISTPLLVSSAKLEYGFYEIRARVAEAPLLSSFWLQGDGGEINILDVSPGPDSSADAPRSVNGYHCFELVPDGEESAGNVDEQASTLLSGINPQTDFHTYGIERSVDGVDFYIDGVLVRELKRSAVATAGCLDMPMSVVFSMETLASIGAPSDFDTYTTQVDYFRFWTGHDSDECNTELVTFGDIQAGIRYASYANRIQTIRPANVAQCQAACAENIECGFYTFKPDSDSGNINNNGGCLLFPEGEGTKTDIGYQSAVKLTDGCPDEEAAGGGGGGGGGDCSPDQVTFGELMPKTRFAAFTDNIGIFKGRSRENCAALCAYESGCGLYSHKSGEQNCLLFPAGLGTKGDDEFVTAIRNPDSCMNAETYALASATPAPLVMPTCESSGLSMFPTEQKGVRVKNLKKKLARRKGIKLHDCFELCAGRPECAQLSYNAATLTCFIFAAGYATRSKGSYVTYEKTCTTCIGGALFSEPMLAVRYEYAQQDQRLASELFGMSAGQCLAWCAANEQCAMVTHDEGRQECIPFPAGINTRPVQGYTTIRRAPGTCEDSIARTDDNYPQCMYEDPVFGTFARFSSALQTWDKVGFKQCLAACVSLDTCGKIAHKAATGKCLLYGHSEELSREDEAFVSFTLKADAPPTDECHPPYGAIQRSEMSDVKSFDDRMQKIKSVRDENLHQEKVKWAREITKVSVIVVGGVILSIGLLVQAKNAYKRRDLVNLKGYILPPGSPDHENPVYGRNIKTDSDQSGDDDVFEDVDAGLDSDISTDMSFADTDLNTSTDSTLSGITRAAMGAAAALYKSAALASAAPMWFTSRDPVKIFNGNAKKTANKSSIKSKYVNGKSVDLNEVEEPRYSTNNNCSTEGYQEFDADASNMFLTADNFNPSLAPSPLSQRKVGPTEVTPLIGTAPLLSRSTKLRHDQAFGRKTMSRDSASDSGLRGDHNNNNNNNNGNTNNDSDARSGGGFFSAITANLPAFNLFLNSADQQDPKADLIAIDRAVDAVVRDVLGSTSTSTRTKSATRRHDAVVQEVVRSISDYEDDEENESESTESDEARGGMTTSGLSTRSVFAVTSDDEDNDYDEINRIGTGTIVRQSLEEKVGNGKISTEEYEKILQVQAAMAQAELDEYLNTSEDSPLNQEVVYPKSAWNITSWMGMN